MLEIEVALKMVPGTFGDGSIDAIKKYAEEIGKLYNPEKVVTSDNLKDAKSDRAYAKKIVDGFNAERISRHNEYEKPYEDWLSQYKEAIKPIEDAVKDLDGKIKAVEAEEEASRISSVNEAILKDADDLRKGLAETVKSNQSLWNRVCKKSYYNKSGSTVKNTEEWRTSLLTISRDLEVIESSNGKDNLLIAYLNNGDLATAMQEVEGNARRLKQASMKKTVEEPPTVPEPTVYTVTIPSEDSVPPEEQKNAKALRWILGPKWKIRLLFKIAADLGITFATYEERR